MELQTLLLVCASRLQPQSHSYATTTSRRSSKPTGLMVKLCLGLLEGQLLVSTLTSKETYKAGQSSEWTERHFPLEGQIRVVGVTRRLCLHEWESATELAPSWAQRGSKPTKHMRCPPHCCKVERQKHLLKAVTLMKEWRHFYSINNCAGVFFLLFLHIFVFATNLLYL